MMFILTDMSTKIQFTILFGEGTLEYGPMGVVANGFKKSTKYVENPGSKSFADIFNWLARGVRVDLSTHHLMVQTFVNWSNEAVFWELMTIENTEQWQSYVQNGLQRGWPLVLLARCFPNNQANVEAVQDVAVHNDEDVHNEAPNVEDDTQNQNIEAEGVADEGEIMPSIVQQMENETMEAAAVANCDDLSDEDEQFVRPTEWRNPGFGTHEAYDAKHQEFEYRENEVVVGAKYNTSAAMKDAVKRWAVSMGKEFRVAKSSPSDYDVVCLKADCPWRVHAHKGIFKTYWKVTIVVEHTCILDGVQRTHKNLSTEFVANEIYSMVMERMHLKPRIIIRHIERKFHYTINYAKAWRAKQRAFEMRFGTYEASYHNLPAMLETIKTRNPGTQYYTIEIENPDGGPSILQRTFFCLGACVRAFQYCLPVLCIDGTFLTGKYRGTILTAIAVDGNHQLLPVALAFVESENTESWFWFLSLVKAHIVGNRPNVCLISDRHAGIIAAIERHLASDWPDLHSRFCLRHMGANWHDHCRNKDLMDLFKRLASQNQERKFNTLWKNLDNLAAKNAGEQADPPRTRPFSNWIREVPKKKWSLLYDTDGRRYGIMTTNNAESYNMVMRGVRALPLVAIVEFMVYGCSRYFRQRYLAVGPTLSNPNLFFGYKMNEYMDDKVQKSLLHDVRVIGTRELRFEITCKGRSSRGIHRNRVVHECILTHEGSIQCSCFKPTLLHKPCSHVIAACREASIAPMTFVSNYYKKETIAAVWEQEVYGFAMVDNFVQEPEQPVLIPDPATKICHRGRRQTRRIRNGMDVAEAGKSKKICTNCGQDGHTYKRCPQQDLPGCAEAGPSGNPGDGEAPDFRRRSVSGYGGIHQDPTGPTRPYSGRHSVSSSRRR